MAIPHLLFLLQCERFQIDLQQENRSKLQGFIRFLHTACEKNK